MQIVGYDQHGNSKTLAQFIEKIQNLALHRNIEAGRRLIRDHQFRFERYGSRHVDTPCLPAGKLVGVTFSDFSWQANEFNEPVNAPLQIASGKAVDAKGLGDNRRNGQPRAQRSDRILKNKRHVPSDILELRRPATDELLSLEDDGSGMRLDKSANGSRDRRFSRTGLTYNCQRFAAPDIERNARHCLNLGQLAGELRGQYPADRIADLQITNGEKRCHCL
jgi:hypothetical protein